MKENLIAEKSFDFAIGIISLSQQLTQKKHYVIADQLLKCRTSIGANIQESVAAQSRKDFLSKMSIAAKEARETHYWLKLINETDLVDEDLTRYLNEIEHMINILTKIVKTVSTQNGARNNKI